MSRAVVVGPYPPTADPNGAVTLAAVRALRADGHDVLVVSPEPSAARVDAPPHTRRGARRIARLVRGTDIVVWVGPDPTRVLARALRNVPDVRVLEHTPPPATRPSIGTRVRNGVSLMRAGVPTFVRTLRRRRQ